MFHLRSRYAVICFKLAAWMLFIKWLMIPAAFISLIGAWIRIDKQLAWLALSLFAAAGLVGIMQWGLATLARCPLCLSLPIAPRICSKHRNAKRIMGSYRLRVACTVIFKRYFRCPYCGESTTVDTRANSS